MGIPGAQKKYAVGLFKLSSVCHLRQKCLMVWCIWLWSYLYPLLPSWHWLFWLSSHSIHAVNCIYPPANKSVIIRKKNLVKILCGFFSSPGVWEQVWTDWEFFEAMCCKEPLGALLAHILIRLGEGGDYSLLLNDSSVLHYISICAPSICVCYRLNALWEPLVKISSLLLSELKAWEPWNFWVAHPSLVTPVQGSYCCCVQNCWGGEEQKKSLWETAGFWSWQSYSGMISKHMLWLWQ